MRKRHLQLSGSEIAQLRVAEDQTRDVQALRRLQGVRLYGSGMSVRQIKDMIGCSESALRNWVHGYERGGVDALASHYEGSAGNANKLSPAQRSELTDRLNTDHPDQLIPAGLRMSEGPFWTVLDVQVVVEQWYGVSYQDQGSYRNLLRACGFSYHRAEKVYKSRPPEVNVAEFEAELEKK